MLDLGLWTLDVLSSLANLFFPAQCRICRELLPGITRVPVCQECWGKIEPTGATGQCSLCGLPVEGDLAALPQFRCGDCVRHPPSFDLARSYGVYGGPLRELVHLLKYQGMTPLAGPLGERMAEAAQRVECREAFATSEGVVPMPLDAVRRRQRGYNQAELLAREVARRLSLPLFADACQRVRATATQAGLTRPQRRANVQGAFAANPKVVADRTVILVDDVMTTGATLSACSRALFQAGAARILCLTLARTAEPFGNMPGDDDVV